MFRRRFHLVMLAALVVPMLLAPLQAHADARQVTADGCYLVDFSEDPLGNPLPAGTIVAEQYAAWGVHITSNRPATNPPLIFDSANPTGGDDDLGTPNEDFGGPGIGAGGSLGAPGQNDVSLGNVLIIADNIVDSDNDGLVDDPNDLGIGGSLVLTFDQPFTVVELDVLDIDFTSSGTVTTYDAADNVISITPVQNLGDNSYQMLMIGDADVRRMVVTFEDSGAIDHLELCPEAYDMGDLPDFAPGNGPNEYNTVISDGGPQHIVYAAGTPGRLFLGASVDVEPDGQPDFIAAGDTPDEDGVARHPTDNWVSGNQPRLQFVVTGGTGRVVGWIDWNRNGVFEAATEAFDFGNLGAGAHELPLPAPIPAGFDPEGGLYARFRLFDPVHLPAGDILDAHVGPAVNGEVEDYFWQFTPTAVTLQGTATASTTGQPLALVIGLFGLLAAATISVLRRRNIKIR